jgi:hypothetical protein
VLWHGLKGGDASGVATPPQASAELPCVGADVEDAIDVEFAKNPGDVLVGELIGSRQLIAPPAGVSVSPGVD